MDTYRFETVTTMKPYNHKKWWIDADIVRPIEIEANNIKEALRVFRDKVIERGSIEISDYALKTRVPLCIDRKDGTTVQVGYVITGKTSFDKGDYSGYVEQYIDLWVSILKVTIPEF